MVHADTHKLDNGDPFPEMQLQLLDGSTLTLPDDAMGRWSVLITYRNYDDESCREYLARFQECHNTYSKKKITLVAASALNEDDARKGAEDLRLNIPIAYGLIPREFSILTGAFYDPLERTINPSGFLIDPSGRIALVVYSSGPAGLLDPDDLLKLIEEIDASRPK
ncbi:MAG: redoxin domain-containing protein [Candidatus Zixiibacteriota bacterium]|jgi:peroxiredoxin